MTEFRMGSILGLAEPRQPGPEHARSEGLEYAVSIIGQNLRSGSIYVTALDEDASTANAYFTPVFQRRGYGPAEPLTFAGYEVEAGRANELRALYTSKRRAAEVIREALGLNLFKGFSMPEDVAKLAGAVMMGWIEMPRPERKKPSLLHRDTLIAGIAKRVSLAYSVPLGAAKPRYDCRPLPTCGVTVAAAALRGFGLPMDWKRADAIVREHQENAEKLEKTGALTPSNLRNTSNALRAYSQPEYFADASEFGDELEAALRALGHSSLLPRFDAEQ